MARLAAGTGVVSTDRKEDGMSTTNFSNDPGAASSGSDGLPMSKGQAKQAADTASQEGQHVAGVAKDEVKNVAGEAQNQLRGLLDQATSQVDEQSRQQKGRLAETVRTFGDDLQKMSSSEDNGVAAQVVQQVADQARGLASHLEGREPSELLDDVRRFARRRPARSCWGTRRRCRGRTRGTRREGRAGHPVDRCGGSVHLARMLSHSPAVLTEEPLATSGTGNGDLPTDLGAKGVEMSEAGISSGRGPA